MLDVFRQNSLKTDEECMSSFREWYLDREEILGLVEQTVNNFTEVVSGDMGTIEESIGAIGDAAEQLTIDMDREFNDILKNLKIALFGEDGKGGMSKLIEDITNKFKT